MATFKIVVDNSPYYVLDISFADQTFRQQTIFQETGEWLNVAMQAYADRYELDWIEAQQIALEESDTPQ